jgi:hypothetical protein
LEVGPLACVVDVNADKVAVYVVVEDESFRFADKSKTGGGHPQRSAHNRH